MTIVHLGGIDPGLVHTGVVSLLVDSQQRAISVSSHVVNGPNAGQVAAAVDKRATLFIEKYEDRGTVFTQHSDMRKFEVELHKLLPKATILSNTGVRKVVTEQMLRVLGLTGFRTTHHKDLESAARIAVYGGLKDPAINAVFYQALTSYTDGRPWQLA